MALQICNLIVNSFDVVNRLFHNGPTVGEDLNCIFAGQRIAVYGDLVDKEYVFLGEASRQYYFASPDGNLYSTTDRLIRNASRKYYRSEFGLKETKDKCYFFLGRFSSSIGRQYHFNLDLYFFNNASTIFLAQSFFKYFSTNYFDSFLKVLGFPSYNINNFDYVPKTALISNLIGRFLSRASKKDLHRVLNQFHKDLVAETYFGIQCYVDDSHPLDFLNKLYTEIKLTDIDRFSPEVDNFSDKIQKVLSYHAKLFYPVDPYLVQKAQASQEAAAKKPASRTPSFSEIMNSTDENFPGALDTVEEADSFGQGVSEGLEIYDTVSNSVSGLGVGKAVIINIGKKVVKKAVKEEIRETVKKKFGDSNSGGKRVREVNGRQPINHQYADKVYPQEKLPLKNKKTGNNVRGDYPHSVPFDGNGYPDFSRYAEKKVKVKTTGKRRKDFAAADRMASIDANYRKENNLVWHHHQDGKTMQLIPKEIHDAVRHTGGIANHK